MTRDETHEGWANRETWAVALAIDNDRAELGSVVVLAEDLGDEQFEPVLRERVEDQCRVAAQAARQHARYPFDGEMAEGLLECALARVNWRELAEHYRRKVRDVAEARR